MSAVKSTGVQKMTDKKLYTLAEFSELVGGRSDLICRILDAGDIRPHNIEPDHIFKPFSVVINSLRFSDDDIEPFKAEIRRRKFEDFKVAYADVYAPDQVPGARGLEVNPGWTGILENYCNQLREWRADGWSIKLRWAKEKFGSIRIFSNIDHRTMTPLQAFRLSRLDEWARRRSLQTCQECGRPGRLRWGSHAATLCDRHKHLVGELRAEDGVILDPDRQKMDKEGRVHGWPENFLGRYTWTDTDLGLDEGQTMDLAKSMEIEFRPFLSPDLRLDGTDLELADLRKKLLAVDQAIGRHHWVKFQLRQRGYEIAIDTTEPCSTVDEIRRDAIIAEIEMIMSGEHV
ncbi:hypothetical protein U8C31_18190 [Sinorhizobium medicae]|uniref:hypothetical protein n=1 Tax=Sinorhizobium medicae TaxID=110321 RepID=UPI002AF6B1C9|nr:hypothetical protein [Sinorhizobium medicae]WQO72167.1 hypothetical protein U8C31_18190 [Sinorhizobium medicae]